MCLYYKFLEVELMNLNEYAYFISIDIAKMDLIHIYKHAYTQHIYRHTHNIQLGMHPRPTNSEFQGILYKKYTV